MAEQIGIGKKSLRTAPPQGQRRRGRDPLGNANERIREA